ncbi:GNAT family N-acetyltransferase [Tenacibaculum singaporense]|uniref:GNAT family N-acetyltransferase n=1 Tax=Tenacibaculum singaporense TaxID=2358479 RepID=UPI000F68A813|nr:GNAT family N-acetyltransferase [Tenacibaculum singaporense]RSC93489.1 GNAT family N-acetyltransferase [Tenacibaculum singaporense]
MKELENNTEISELNVVVKKYGNLSSEEYQTISAFSEKEFGNVPIVQKYKWAKPDWVVIKYTKNKLVSFCNLVEREIRIDQKTYFVAGINNMITLEKYRGSGYAAEVLNKCEHFILQFMSFDYGVLLCADSLVPFYEKHGWYSVDCPVYFQQPSGRELWKARTMLLGKDKQIAPKEIDLNGLPW